MPQSLANLWVHIIFSTKNRTPYLNNMELRLGLHEYLSNTCNTLNCPAMAVGGVADHVHILCYQSKTITVAKLIEKLKRSSSIWMKKQRHTNNSSEFYWQNGYGIFSVSQSNLAAVRKYIHNQIQHHKKFDFQDEYRKFLQMNGIDYTEKYLWN